MTKRFVLSVDQGSSSSRATIFDSQGRIRAKAQVSLPTSVPKPGWVEHNPEQILSSQRTVIRRVLEMSGRRKIHPDALGVANQRSTILIWDRRTGSPLAPAISWQDRRASDLCASLRRLSRRHPDQLIARKTGLRLTPYYAAPKLAWLLQKIPGARKRAERGDLLCGTVNTHLIWHLTNREVHVTDHTNAARMLLMDLSTLNWDPELLSLFDIPPQILPAIAPTCGYLGEAAIGKARIPIFSSVGDQQAASIGLGCIETGDLTLNYGTGGFLLLNTGDRPRFLPGLLTSIAWSSAEKISYLLEGTVNSVGSAIEWLRDGLGLFKQYREIPALFNRSSERVYALPALAGLGAPYWREDVSAQFLDLTRNTRAADLVRATIEGIAFLMKDIFEAMEPAGLRRSPRSKAGGGIARLDPLIQFQADLLRIPIERPAALESTSLGAAFLAGLGCGIWSHPKEIQKLVKKGRTFKPVHTRGEMEALYRGWKKMTHNLLQQRDR